MTEKKYMSERPFRWIILAALLACAFLFGVARLVDLQIIRGGYFKELAEGNRIRRIPVRAPRGLILDRNGKPLARNAPVYKLATFSTGGLVEEAEEISREEALRIQSEDPEGASRLLLDIKREYPLVEAAAHLVGYVGEVVKDEVGRLPPGCESHPVHILGDLRGRTGIEAQYDCLLQGINGEELIEVDTRGRLVRRLGRREPMPGKDVKLSIDFDLQKVAYEALINAPNEKGTRPAREEGIIVRGAFVAQDPQSGEVLALSSAPSFDPNKVGEDYPSLASDPNLSLFNRAIAGEYHPGSTFKIVTGTGGLEDGKIDRDWEFADTGIIQVGNFSYRNWYFTQYGRTEGKIMIVRAITRSTDTFFYKVGELVGPERIAFWARRFGLGEKTGIDLSGEKDGLVPDPEWKKRVKGERWFLGNTYHMAIGQGDITTTPLQVNRMTQVIASGGELCKPKIEKDREKVCEDLGVSKETIGIIKEGMIGACSTGGTAYPLFNFEPRVACKTGTAQTPGDQTTHAWLTAFSPQDSPQIVATVLIEHGGEGSRVAAPVVKEVLDWWIKLAQTP